jgi:putative peptidoglycan lipid II flippase
MSDEPAVPSSPQSVSSDHAQRHGALSRAVQATSLMTLASRVGGLARDVIIGRIFGPGLINSAFQAAFAIPNMFRRLFGEGALSAAFIPEYTSAHKDNPAEAARLASLTLFALGALTGAITVIAEVVLLILLFVLPHDSERNLSLKLIMIMLPFMPLICMVAILAGMLQVHGKFAAAASGPVILNTFIIGAGVYSIVTGNLGGEKTAFALGIATTLSGLTQLIYFLKLLKPHVHWTRTWDQSRTRAKRMLEKFVPVAIGLGTLQLNTFLDTLIAMWPIWVGPTILGLTYPLDDHSNALLQLASRLYQFPLGVFGIAVASAAFPLLARHANEPAHFFDTLRRGLRLSLYIGLPATFGLILIRHDVVGVMFGHGHGKWTPEDLRRCANVLAAFSVGIWAYSLNQVFTRAFYAKGDTKTPMRVSIAMMIVNVALNCSLIWIPNLRESGLAWSTALSAILQTIVLLILAQRRLASSVDLREHHVILDAPAARAALKILGASLIMSACVWPTLYALPLNSPFAHHDIAAIRSPWAWQVARLTIGVAVGGINYLAMSRVLKIPELGWLIRRR